MQFLKKFIAYNFSKRSTRPEYICVHDTGNTGRGANALSHFNYFNGGDRQASADIFVDDSMAVQIIDYLVNYSWAVGDGRGAYGITNGNSVSIEICINSDGNYAQAVTNAVEVVRGLMAELNIPIDRVVRHYDASRKSCPGSMMANDWSAWYAFKNRLAGQSTPAPSQPSTPVSAPSGSYRTVTADVLNVRSGQGTNFDVVGTLKEGDKVRVDRDFPSGWTSIYFGAHGGFVSTQYLSGSTPAPAQPVTPAPTPTPSGYKTVTADVLNVRSGQGTSYAVIGTLKQGEKVRVDRNFPSGWTSIYFGAHGGFVSTQYLE